MYHPRYPLIARLIAATVAAYAFSQSVAILLCQALIQLLQTPQPEALMISTLVALTIYIAACFGCFVVKSVARLWCTLLAGSIISGILAVLLGFTWGPV